ncbi:hypothetical protein FAM09_07095 [Niastella caeni]|uniref:Zinc finger CHC2-type domain-containing protein n=1 Tax=Niastella caeni TaxID=2569763 RepID=A0A4S8I2Z3_9BACT|nr:toprim domain-containing protein [Niastella caeni]THU41859.1 hypothetical protein FAM09_07095 [Niastella caeni]
MNCEQAKSISIIDLLTKLGHKPVKVRKHKVRYLSPYRDERTASFDVHPINNEWYDHGDKQGGNIINLALNIMKYLNPEQDYTVSDALRWLENMSGLAPSIKPIQEDKDYSNNESCLSLTKVTAIERPRLIEYLASRGIPLSVGKKYMQQALIYNNESGKHFYTLSFKNEEGGYELRNPFFKGCIKPKDVTFIRGKKPEGGIHLFEGSMDYLTVVTINKGKALRDDAIILNSVSCMDKATGYIKGYGYKVAYSWMDNDMAGKDATASLDAFFKTEDGLQHQPMNYMYAPYKDVNAWHQVKLGLCEPAS